MFTAGSLGWLRPALAGVLPAVLLLSGLFAAPASATRGVEPVDQVDTTLADQQALNDGILPELTASADLDADSLAIGSLTDQDGAAVAGVPVLLYAWPPTSELANMANGDTLRLIPVAKDLTDQEGSFDLRTPAVDQLAAVTDPQTSAVNLELVVPTAEGSEMVAFTDLVEFADGDYTVSPADQTVTEKVDEGPTNLGDVMVEEPTQAVELANQTKHHNDYLQKACRTQRVYEYPQRPTRVGQVYSTAANASMQFIYNVGNQRGVKASITLGIGKSSSGATGSFSAGGSVTEFLGVETTWQPVTGVSSKFYDKYTTYVKFKIQCVMAGQGAVITTRYEARPTAVNGANSGNLGSAPSVPSANCSRYNPGFATVQIDQGGNTTWSNGVDISAYLGVSLSSHAGYNWGTKVIIKSTDVKKGLSLCGRSGKIETPNQGDTIAKPL
jgi:hypothetical protein